MGWDAERSQGSRWRVYIDVGISSLSWSLELIVCMLFAFVACICRSGDKEERKADSTKAQPLATPHMDVETPL